MNRCFHHRFETERNTSNEPAEFDAKYKSPWIQTVGVNPLVLVEPPQSTGDNPFGLVEETFEKFGSLPAEYVKMGSQYFMEKYCWG